MLSRMSKTAQKNTALIRSIPYWALVVLSLVAAGIGGWLVWDNTTTMARTLLDGTATNIEVYVGQAWITAGAGILAAGIIGILLALVVAAAKALVSAGEPVVVEQIDWAAQDEETLPEPAEESTDSATERASETEQETEDGQNGSSGSTATATKISVK